MAETDVVLSSGRTKRQYRGDFIVVGVVNADDGGAVTARVEYAPAPKTGIGLFVVAVEMLRRLVETGVVGPHVEAAKAALAAVDALDPTKLCPYCGRRPRKDSEKAIWTQDHVLLACERCRENLSRKQQGRLA